MRKLPFDMPAARLATHPLLAVHAGACPCWTDAPSAPRWWEKQASRPYVCAGCSGQHSYGTDRDVSLSPCNSWCYCNCPPNPANCSSMYGRCGARPWCPLHSEGASPTWRRRQQREALAQLRTGSPWGAEETGRCERQPREGRICPHCQLGVEDATHMSFNCLLYAPQRRRWGTCLLSPDPLLVCSRPTRMAGFVAACRQQWEQATAALVAVPGPVSIL